MGIIHQLEAAKRRAATRALEETKGPSVKSSPQSTQSGKAPSAKGTLFGLSEKRPRGRPKKDGALEQITLRLDPRVLAHYRATGEGWQARINETLKKTICL